jgi:DNA mismatch endonuclease, patch repair protein
MKIRRELHKLKIAFATNERDLPGCPDLVFRRHKIAVFVDGDFWHGRDLLRRLAKLERGANGPYWTLKLTTNVRRDLRIRSKLRRDGWSVLRLWETDINSDPRKAALRIQMRLLRRRTLVKKR